MKNIRRLWRVNETKPQEGVADVREREREKTKNSVKHNFYKNLLAGV